MKSTGEVMGVADSVGLAYAKAQIGAGDGLPLLGTVFVTVHDRDKPTVLPIIRRFHQMGFKILATSGTGQYLSGRGIPVETVLKVYEGRPNAADLIVSGAVQLLINTPLGKLTARDDYLIRRTALQHRVPYTTTMSAAAAACDAIAALKGSERTVRCLQEWYQMVRPADVSEARKKAG
jgi:carbamoyl-phosphate synthase large subunit